MLLPNNLQHIHGHFGKLELGIPAPLGTGSAVVHVVRPGVGNGFLHRRFTAQQWKGCPAVVGQGSAGRNAPDPVLLLALGHST